MVSLWQSGGDFIIVLLNYSFLNCKLNNGMTDKEALLMIRLYFPERHIVRVHNDCNVTIVSNEQHLNASYRHFF